MLRYLMYDTFSVHLDRVRTSRSMFFVVNSIKTMRGVIDSQSSYKYAWAFFAPHSVNKVVIYSLDSFDYIVRDDGLEKRIMSGKIDGKRDRGHQRMT